MALLNFVAAMTVRSPAFSRWERYYVGVTAEVKASLVVFILSSALELG